MRNEILPYFNNASELRLEKLLKIEKKEIHLSNSITKLKTNAKISKLF